MFHLQLPQLNVAVDTVAAAGSAGIWNSALNSNSAQQQKSSSNGGGGGGGGSGDIDRGMRELQLRLESDLEEWDASSASTVTTASQQQQTSSVRH